MGDLTSERNWMKLEDFTKKQGIVPKWDDISRNMRDLGTLLVNQDDRSV